MDLTVLIPLHKKDPKTWIRNPAYKREDKVQNLEVWLKYLITAGFRSSFICDSHPWLCKCCWAVRDTLRGTGRQDRVVYTKSGRYKLTWEE